MKNRIKLATVILSLLPGLLLAQVTPDQKLTVEKIVKEATENSQLETLAVGQLSFLMAVIRKVSGIFVRSDIEVSQAKYKMKQERAAKAALLQGTPGALSLEEKHKLGLYHLME